MQLKMKRVISFALFFTSVSQLAASENLIWQWVNKIKLVNPKECPVASYQQIGDSLRITCTDHSRARYSYVIPLTAHPDSSFHIDSDKYIDINNGLDSVYLRGHYLGQATKETTRVISAPRIDRNPEAFPKVPTDEQTNAVIEEFGRLLAEIPAAQLTAQRGEVHALARESKRPLVRSLGYAALITDGGSPSEIWELAGNERSNDVIRAIPWIGNSEFRSELYAKARPQADVPADDERQAAFFFALPSVPGHDEEIFQTLRPSVGDGFPFSANSGVRVGNEYRAAFLTGVSVRSASWRYR